MGLGDIVLRTFVREILPYSVVFGVGFSCGYYYSQNKTEEQHPKAPYENFINVKDEDAELRRVFEKGYKNF